MAHKTTTLWKGGMLFESDNPSGNYVLMDTTDEGIPHQKGVSPKAMMLSSLADCSGIDIVDILKKMKITDYNLKLLWKANLQKNTQNTIIRFTSIIFFRPEIDKKKCNRAVQLSINKYCGVMEMFRKFATINTKIHFQK